MQRIIELSYNNHEEMFDLPINPSEFEFSRGTKQPEDHPAEYRRSEPDRAPGAGDRLPVQFFSPRHHPVGRYTDREPMEYIRLLEKWKTSTQPICVIISDCDFNLAMSIDKLTRKHREGDKDVYYTLELSEYRFLNVPAVQVKTPTTKRDQRAEHPPQHTGRSNDLHGSVGGLPLEYRQEILR